MMNFAAQIESGEDEKIEFKTTFNQEVVESVCAFANRCGGTIFLGVKSQKNVPGVQIGRESLQKWINEIKSKTDPIQIPDVEKFEYRGKTVVALLVRESVVKPVAVHGRCFLRHENSNHVMSPAEIGDCILQTQNSSWDYVLDESSSMEEISLSKVGESIRRINLRGYHIPPDPMEFLTKNRLFRNGKLTFAAEMLFAKDWHVNTAVQMGFFQSETIIKDRDEAHGDLVGQVNQVFDFVKKHINCAVVISGKPENDLVWDYPLEAVRELILNMIVHRDYRLPSESCVKVFDNRIEFFNPGRLLDGMDVEDLLNNRYLSTLRNKAIANHFHLLGEIEKFGSGVTRVLRLFRESGLPSPKYEAINGGIRVTVFARSKNLEVADKVQDKVENKVQDKVQDKFHGWMAYNALASDTAEEKILLLVMENSGCRVGTLMKLSGFSDGYIRKILAKLCKNGRVEHRGSNKTGGYFAL